MYFARSNAARPLSAHKRHQRRSMFTPAANGLPMLLAVLLARQHEEAGESSDLIGMPLGLPSMSPKQIQLVESWIEQGRPR